MNSMFLILALAAGPQEIAQHPTIQDLAARSNQQRATYRLPAASLNADMCLFAQRHANWMSSTGRYQHSGGPYAEIIFEGPTNAAWAIQGWMNSPGHREIILGGYHECGFGYQRVGNRHFWVGVYR